jgi:hypothetical protein
MELILVQRDRAVAPLKQAPGLARPRVDEAGVKPVRARQRQREPGGVGGREDEMDMVRHETISPDRDVEFPARLRQPISVQFVIAVVEKNPFAPVAALRDVMGRTGDDDAGDAGHARI